MSARIGLIWAQARDGVIGNEGTLPWHLPEDLAHFRAITASWPVVMGRKTWDSLPPRYRPLPGRENVVLTRNTRWHEDGAHPVHSAGDSLEVSDDGWIWVIGGGQVFRLVMDQADRLEVTEIDQAIDGDTKAPSTDGWAVTSIDPATGWHTSREGLRYRFVTYSRAASESERDSLNT